MAPAKQQPAWLPAVVAMLVMVVWGATPVVTKIATAEIDPLLVALLRTVGGGSVSIVLIAAMRLPLPQGRRSLALLVISAASGFVVFPILYTIGQRETSAMHGGLILAALPLFTGSYVAMVDRRRPRPRWIFGCLLALAGEALLVTVRTGGGQNVTSLVGDLLVLVSALLVATGYVAGAKLGQGGYGSVATTLWGVALATTVSAPLAAGFVLIKGLPQAGAMAWSSILWLCVLTTIIGYLGWYWALAKGGIARIATIQFLQPISGLVLAMLLLGEEITLPILLATAAILAGVAIAQRG